MRGVANAISSNDRIEQQEAGNKSEWVELSDLGTNERRIMYFGQDGAIEFESKHPLLM